MPVFETPAPLLMEAVASVLAQTMPCELVVVDDGSAAVDTLDALSSLRARGVRVLRQENAGPAAARNAGILQAQSEFILPLDADDLLGETFAERVAALLSADPSVEIAYGDVRRFGEVDAYLRLGDELGLCDLVRTNQLVCTSGFRRASWRAVGGYDERLANGFEDHEFWVRLLARGGVARRIDAVFHYRIAAGTRNTAATIEQQRTATRSAIVRNNPQHLGELLQAAWAALDGLEEQIAYERTWRGQVKVRLRATRWGRALKAGLAARGSAAP